ncbi:MAG: hypothetical protein EOP62_22915 [Sphingomonadales bacterium]|nr:MAG: hypothetical protein EOP62_22915 [Sphingomonadales bacterium]
MATRATKLPKGIAKVIRRGPDGEIVSTYFYAWKGGPRLTGVPGSRAFMASYEAALKARRGGQADTLGGLALRYQASPEFAGLAESTKKEWRRRISKISADKADLDIGGLPLAALNDPRVKADILAWRDQWRDTPRGADFLMQVLSRVLSWGQQRGLLALNVVTGMGQLYKSNRSDQIWEADELDAYVTASASPEIGFVVPLACLVGLRLDDLRTLKWSEVGEVAIVKVTAKGRGRRTAVIPLLNETRDLLSRIRVQQAKRHAELDARAKRQGREPPTLPLTVLSNTFGRSWRYSGLETRVSETKAAANPPIQKHLHDARGTFATRLRKAGLTAPEIADVLGWDEERVEKLLTVYVDRDTIVKGIAERIQRLEMEARQGADHSRAAVVAGVELVSPTSQAGEVMRQIAINRRSETVPVVHGSGRRSARTAVHNRSQREEATTKRPLIDLCAYLGDGGVERRSTLVSDEWLGSEIARDPWLFRVVEFEPGYYDLQAEGPIQWPIPADVADRMWSDLKAAHG